MLQAFNVNECVLCEDIVHDGPWTSWILTCGPYFDLLTPLIYIVHISTYPYHHKFNIYLAFLEPSFIFDI